jgi:phosphate transport system protein
MALNLAEDDSAIHIRFAGIRHLGEQVIQMVHDVLDAYARLNVDAALNVVREDDNTDKEYQDLMRMLITYTITQRTSANM